MTADVLQAWRGALARRWCRYLRAAYAIMGYYKRHKVKAYLLELIRRFQGVRSMPDFGKSLAWPEPPAVLGRFQENSQQLFRRCEHIQGVSSPWGSMMAVIPKHLMPSPHRWRARQIVKNIPPSDMAQIRAKVAAMGVLHGLRKDWGCQRGWVRDYLSSVRARS